MEQKSSNSSGVWHGLTWRGVLLGLVMVAIVNFGAPYSSFIVHSTYLATNYFPLGVAFPFFVLVAIVNVILKSFHKRWALHPHELGVVFVMGLVACAIPTYGMTGYLISVLAAPFYFASPENAWASYFHLYIPSWICPHDIQAMKWFFEGIPAGESIPWGAWVKPLFWWLPLIGAGWLLCMSLISMLHAQWVHKERIVFPLAEIPLDMVAESDAPRLLPKFMQTRAFWFGFIWPVFMILWNIAGYFRPGFFHIDLNFGYLRIGHGFPSIRMRIYPPMMGIAFLLHLDVSFSVWLFYVLGVLQVGIFNRIGYTIGSSDIYCSSPPPMGWQGFGGMIVLVFASLWLARSHVKEVFLKAIGRSKTPEPQDGLLSYRAAAFGFLFSLAFIFLWLLRAGMTPSVASLFLFAALVIYIGLTRIVAEGGLVFLRGPLIPQSFAANIIGTANISPRCMTALGFSYAWFCDPIAIFMPSGANAAKIGSALKIHRRSLTTAIVIALVVGSVISLWYTLYLGYQSGAYNFGEWVFRGGAFAPFNSIVAKMRNPKPTDWNRLMFLGIGGVTMIVLLMLRFAFAWWPVHPLGFPLAAVGQVMASCFSIFAGWLAKFIVIRFGGRALYEKTRPFFIGTIMGYFFGSGISFFVDMIWFPGEGHCLYLW